MLPFKEKGTQVESDAGGSIDTGRARTQDNQDGNVEASMDLGHNHFLREVGKKWPK